MSHQDIPADRPRWRGPEARGAATFLLGVALLGAAAWSLYTQFRIDVGTGQMAVLTRKSGLDVNNGYREKSIVANLMTDAGGALKVDASGEPVTVEDSSGISFPSNDGFPINMDFTAVWGIMPDQAAGVIRKFGNVDAVEAKVVVPQIESIGRQLQQSRPRPKKPAPTTRP